MRIQEVWFENGERDHTLIINSTSRLIEHLDIVKRVCWLISSLLVGSRIRWSFFSGPASVSQHHMRSGRGSNAFTVKDVVDSLQMLYPDAAVAFPTPMVVEH